MSPMTAPRPRSVLFLLCSIGLGGSEVKTVRLANALAARGVDVTVAYLSKLDTLAAIVDPRVRLVHLERRGRLSLGALGRLVALLRECRARTLISVNLYPTLYAALAQLWLGGAASRAGPAGAGAGEARLRFLACVNTSELLPRERLKMPLYRWALRRADGVVFGAERQRRLWRERHGVGSHPHTTSVLYNGVDTDRFAPRQTAELRGRIGIDAKLLVGTVGRLRPEKAHVDLLRATAALRARGLDVGALIVGDGRMRATLEAEIERLGLGRHAALVGECHDVRPYLACLDVFALTSVAVETFSNATLEAMACGLPIVSSSIGGMAELLAFGGGVTYPPGDVEALTAGLAGLLENPERRARLGDEARRAAVERFSWSRMVEEFLELIDERASSGHGPCEGLPLLRAP
jgi:L-malate glycosyltransferase